MSTVTQDFLHLTVVVIVIFLVLGCRFFYRTRSPRLPPGPKPLPIVGNILQMPIEYQEKMFYEWRKTYGDVIYAQVFQKSLIVLNSLEAARDLMEKRSGNYSSRPKMTMMSDILGWDTLTLIPYGNRCRKMRKWTQEAFQKKESLASCMPIQRREAGRTLSRLLENPERFSVLLTTFAASIIMEVTYGHQAKSEDDHFIKIAELALDVTAKIGGHGSSLVDFFPFLRHYPLWAPGSRFMYEAMHARKLVQNVINAPYDMVKSKLLASHHGAGASMVSNLLEGHLREGKIAPQEEADIRGAAATIYGAGTETTATVLKTFVLVMVRQPEIFQNLQREMDRIVGLERLPDFDDRLALPYLNAVIKELYRWQIPVPLGIPHMVDKDDLYRGYWIPAQSMLIANIWGISRDESIYHQPHDFLPERYLDETLSPDKAELMDPKNLVFGFGRRLCPGKDFADSSIYLMLAYITATMNITKAKDENGNDITPPAEFESGSSSRPKPFRCAISPRSAMAVHLIRQMNVSY